MWWLWFFLPILFVLPLLGSSEIDSFFYFFRLSRVLAAFFVGAGISLSAFLLQNLTRNTLSSEYTLGISASASFFAAIGVFFSLSPIFLSFVGGIGASFLIFFVFRKKSSGLSLILFGILLNIFFSAGISFLNYLTSFQISQSLPRWIFGGFSFYTVWEIAILGFFSLVLLFFALIYAPQLTLISISPIYEQTLSRKLRIPLALLLFFLGVFITLAVSLAGPIPFFALVCASFFRNLFSVSPRFLPFLVFVASGLILALLDSMSRLFNPVEDIPVGVLTGILGLPFLIYLFYKNKNQKFYEK